MKNKRILILYYSFSSQTRNLLNNFIKGLEENDMEVLVEKLTPVEDLRFPLGSFFSTFVMMVKTFLRIRLPIEPISKACFSDWDLIIVAGPTWSYNPSGPVLSLIDRDGKELFANKTIMPFISCRGYWRMHAFGLRMLLKHCGAKIIPSIVFSHPTLEPWRTIGVFLKIAGRSPEKSTSWLRRLYPKYGHSRDQMESAFEIGKSVACRISEGEESLLDFPGIIQK